MLTGEFPITSGRAVIDGFDVSTNLRNVRHCDNYVNQHMRSKIVHLMQVQQRIGYCPQVMLVIVCPDLSTDLFTTEM